MSNVKVNGGVRINAGSNGIEVKVAGSNGIEVKVEANPDRATQRSDQHSNGIEIKSEHNKEHADSSAKTVNQNNALNDNKHNAELNHSNADDKHTDHSNHSNANSSPLAREVKALGQQVRDKIARQHDSPNRASQSLSNTAKPVNLSRQTKNASESNLQLLSKATKPVNLSQGNFSPGNDPVKHETSPEFDRHSADHSEHLKSSIVEHILDSTGERTDSSKGLKSPIVEYLHEGKEGNRLTPEVRKVLDAVTTQLGSKTIKDAVSRSDQKFVELLEQILAPAERSPGRSNSVFGNTATHAPLSNTHESSVLDELTSVLYLKKYFNALERTGGDVVQRAETATLRFLSQQPENGGVRQRAAAELLRDLRSGAFVPAQDSYTPFPLTGRARVVSEMIELMRTLDAIEHMAQACDVSHGQSPEGEAAGGILAGKNAASDAGVDKMLAGAMPEETLAEIVALPGRAGRLELARLVTSLNGMLMTADGKPLLVADHQTLKLDQLMWSGAAGGLPAASLSADSFPTRLSPLLIYGFDAVYSLIGFDGRGLTPPRFAHVQVQVNSSESEWVFGQPPLSDGWLRAVIERLKDSLLPNHNLLGEKLEESLLEGCFHTVLLRGEVQDGEPVRESFTATNPLPGLTGNPAFA